ncbi:DUF4097 family beta strand repeat-containing protein [Bacillus sp. 03113]|uniref:DUF4097 family beta strand repeat-containing protein n=1 Tax=Bacillus sp. 03113 TaxID=2578211 RepID=UPI001144EEB6|nr:DUF4097 family beta strand repeat-containing protein [Bacillus sp. 03113]
MINLKKLSIIALILLLIGAAGSLLTFRFTDRGILVSEEKTFTQNNITAVEVDSDNASVEIVPTKDPVTKVELSGKGSKNTKQAFTANAEGNKLIIKLKEEHFKLFSFDFLTKSLTVKVSLPEKQYEAMEIDNDNGHVEVEDLEIKNLNAETNNGHVELKNILSDNVEVESDNGRLTLEQVSGKINGKTNNGKISIKTTDLDRPMKLDTDNGSIEVETEKEPSNVTFNVHVDNGRINILDKYSGNAVIGNGENLIQLSTNNGRITVAK